MRASKIQNIINRFEDVLQNDPWYGTSVYDVLDNYPAGIVHKKAESVGHTPLEILYHMITWTEFTMRRLERKNDGEPNYSEKLDWRPIDPKIHTWKKGVAELKRLNKQLTAFLKKKNDAFLEEQADYRSYNFEYLLYGLADHHIYHIGQIAILKNILS